MSYAHTHTHRAPCSMCTRGYATRKFVGKPFWKSHGRRQCNKRKRKPRLCVTEKPLKFELDVLCVWMYRHTHTHKETHSVTHPHTRTHQKYSVHFIVRISFILIFALSSLKYSAAPSGCHTSYIVSIRANALRHYLFDGVEVGGVRKEQSNRAIEGDR